MHRTTKLTPSILDAALNDQPEVLEQAWERLSPDHPTARGYRAILDAAAARKGAMPAGTAQISVDASLESPPDDLALLQVVMNSAVELALYRGDRRLATRLLDRLRQIDDLDARPEIHAQRLIAEAHLKAAAADYDSAYTETTQALELAIEVGSHFWRQLKFQRLDYACRSGYAGRADQDLADLKKYLDPTQPGHGAQYVFQRVRRCLISGDYDEAERLLTGLTPGQQQIHAREARHWRLVLMIETGRTSQVDQLLKAMDPAKLPPGQIDRYQTYAALVRGDLEDARLHARAALSSHGSSYADAITQHHLVLLDLAAGKAVEARKGLSLLDPKANQPRFYLEWARLCLLENDEPRAVRYFRRMVRRCVPGQMECNLKVAFELSAHQLARLQRLAAELQEEPDETPQPRPAAIPRDSQIIVGDEIEQRLIGRSKPMAEVRRRIARFAGLDSHVLISGETGTGKEIVSRLLHDMGPRPTEPFTAINCGRLTDTLIESELFGHVKGAFTGATRDHPGLFVEARTGTLFLDEVNAMSPRLQAALLRVLENQEVRPVGGSKVRKVRCRVVAASNESLEAAVHAGRFRADLYYRLSRLTIDLPPLRDRVEDIETLAKFFLRAAYGQIDSVLGKDLLEALRQYSWPGNVRELKNEIEYIMLMAGDQQLLTADLFRKSPKFNPGFVTKPPVVREEDQPAGRPAPAMSGHGPGGNGSGGGTADALGFLPEALRSNLRNAHTRRRVLRLLFDQYGKLTRAEVIRLLQCAPNTATTDLQQLQEEGFVRRVQTSNHLRTSFFEKCGK